MEISIDTTTRQITQYGIGLGERDGHTVETIDDALLDTLQQPGIKTLLPDGTVSVTPDLAAQAAEQARLDAVAAARAQRVSDAQGIMAMFPDATDDQKAKFARILGIST